MIVYTMLNKKGHFTPISSALRIITISIMVIVLDMASNGVPIDHALLCTLASIAIITTLCSFIPI